METGSGPPEQMCLMKPSICLLLFLSPQKLKSEQNNKHKALSHGSAQTCRKIDFLFKHEAFAEPPL